MFTISERCGESRGTFRYHRSFIKKGGHPIQFKRKKNTNIYLYTGRLKIFKNL